MRTHQLTFSSAVDAPPAEVWDVVGTMQGVNDELGPWLRMSSPKEAAQFRIEDAPLGDVAFGSWLLVFGVLPIDLHQLKIVSVEPGKGFLEDSTSWTETKWGHQRTLEPLPEGGCAVTDRLTFVPRVGFAGPVLERIVSALFKHRHRRLVKRFSSGSPS